MYIHERKDWPHFFWDEIKIFELLSPLRLKQGRLIGGMESIGFLQKNNVLLESVTQEIVKSSEIEGEILDRSLVRSSVARKLHLGNATLGPVDQNIEGIVTLLLDATQNYHLPVTEERIFNWHRLLFPDHRRGFSKIKVGSWRSGRVEVVSGRIDKEVIHFEGPSAHLVPQEMDIFLNWLNHTQQMDLILKAAIAHLWFVTIHPFDDGNGRIGRALADLLLARSEMSPHRFYSLSAQIQKERKNYYDLLEKTQKGNLEITLWIEWFFGALTRAIENAQSSLDLILQKAEFWKIVSGVPLNQRQKKVLNRLLEGFEGKLTSTKWAKITKCSQDTAYRDILDLVQRGILKKNPEGGRSTSYSLLFPPSH